MKLHYIILVAYALDRYNITYLHVNFVHECKHIIGPESITLFKQYSGDNR